MGDREGNGRFAHRPWLVLCSVLAATAAAARDEAVQLEEIVVTGSRLRMAEPEGPSPVTVFDRQQIEALGVSSVTDVLRYLPAQTYNRSATYRDDGAQFAELRGLGADTTLVLINGRRTVPSASSVSSNAFDLNTIPLAAVERVEVLSDAASAVYGADAVGGVVNIILRRQVQGTTIDVHYGTADGGADEKRASLTSGLNTERFHGSVVLDYLHTGLLPGQARDRWRDQDYTRFGGVDRRSVNANPGNVSSRTAGNLPGLTASFAAVPAGSTGVGLTPADFVATAGMRNYDSLARWYSIVPEGERKSAAVFGEFDVLPQLTLFAEGMYADRTSIAQFNPSGLSGATVPATNPFNPFGVPVASNFVIEGLGPRHTTTDSELARGVIGARGRAGRWDWELSTTATRETAASWMSNSTDASAVAQALASTDPATALNVFEDGPGGSPALLASLIAVPTRNAYVSEGFQGTGFVRGPVLSLPAGDLQVVAGGEWIKERMRYDNFLEVAAERHVSAAFAEVSVPLVNASMRWPLLHGLSLKIAGRFDDYSDFGTSTNPQYGLVWMPVRDLTLRASHGTSFRPPSLFELYAPQVLAPITVSDARRGGEVIDTHVLTGGNPDLDAVTGDSTTAGFVWTPAGVSGLRVSATWWRVDLDRRVAFFPYQLVLANEVRFPGRVVRAAPSAADLAAGRPGPIQSIDISRINYGQLSTRGVDAGLSYAFATPVGDWLARLSGTWVDEYRADDAPGAAPVDRVGIASSAGTIPLWRGTASLAWTRGGWNVTAIGRLVDGYDDVQPSSTQLTGHRIPAQSLLDLQLGWDADAAGAERTWRQGLKATLGITNVFDEEPPYAAVGGSLGYDLSQGDLRQRFAYVTISKRFGH